MRSMEIFVGQTPRDGSAKVLSNAAKCVRAARRQRAGWHDCQQMPRVPNRPHLGAYPQAPARAAVLITCMKDSTAGSFSVVSTHPMASLFGWGLSSLSCNSITDDIKALSK